MRTIERIRAALAVEFTAGDAAIAAVSIVGLVVSVLGMLVIGG